jgi:DNA (cytosine-5)-methyltransferase 1
MAIRAKRKHSPNGDYLCIAGKGNYNLSEGKEAMGIHWEISKKELNQAIPPAYTEYIGRQIIKLLGQ